MAAYPEGDPRNAELTETLAGLDYQYESELGNVAEGLGNLKANIGYAEQGIDEAEPGAYRNEINAANRGGLLESGINSRRKDTLASQFAHQRTGNQLRLTQGETKALHAKERAEHTHTTNRGLAERRAESAAYQEARTNPPITTPTYPIPPAQQAAINAGVPAGPGGVVPYEGGGVRVGPAKPVKKTKTNTVGIG